MKLSLRTFFGAGLLLAIAAIGFAEQAPVYDANPAYAPATEAMLDESSTPRMESIAASDTTANNILLGKINELQQQVQELRGKLEVQAHDLKLLSESQRTLYKDLDQRVAQQAGSDVTTANKAAELTPAPVTASTSPDTDVMSETDKYTLAYQLIKSKKYNQANVAMQAFLREHPNSKYAPNAHYWLGELYMVQGETDKSISEFQTVLKKFPQSSKAASAMLKLGFAYFDMGEWKKSRGALAGVQAKYPDTPTARLALTRLAQMNERGL